ncbi:MAG: response regulator transcription factor [Ardenticatenaceae bacterium]|nr:response regulator transcription factor [Ardenticatenaceae bacterium]
MTRIRILIADDHTLFRRGLASLLNEAGEFQVVGQASSGPEAVRLAGDLRPDVILMDVHMPEGSGVEAVARLKHSAPAVPVIMLTVSENDEDLVSAIRAGARGYFLKNAEVEELYAAIRQVCQGRAALDSSLTEVLFRRLADAPPSAPEADLPLSLREIEILTLIAEGCTNREIAGRLSVSENTVKTHVSRILEKLEVSSRSEAVLQARARGWL